MQRVFANDHWTLERDTKRSLLIVRRTTAPYPSIPTLTKAFDELDAAMDACGRSRFSVLIDLRDAHGRNDPEFERATMSHPRRLVRDFVRAAVLVRTANGMLQVRRSAKSLGERVGAFNNEADALAHLCPPAQEPKPPAAT
jgi:hypothetical protein